MKKYSLTVKIDIPLKILELIFDKEDKIKSWMKKQKLAKSEKCFNFLDFNEEDYADEPFEDDEENY